MKGMVEMKIKALFAAAIAAAAFSTAAYAEGFLYGGDITQLNYVEDNGGKYYDLNGAEEDAMDILDENGVNAVRIRLSNTTGKGTGAEGYYLPEGYQDLEDCIDLAKRASERDMAIQWTFNLSDYWPNGLRQMIPSEWVSEIEAELGYDVNDAEFLAAMTDEQRTEIQDMLGELVYGYVKDVLERLKDEGITPEYVSLGNEMQAGILYPFANINGANYNVEKKSLVYGDDKSDTDVICPSNAGAFANILNRGYDAVKEVDENIQVVLHCDDGGHMDTYDRFIGTLNENGVNFDVIGASYYPAWSQLEVGAVVDFINEVSEKYGKDVLIMETGYNWNETRKDGYPGQLAEFEGYMEKFPFTEEGQAGYMNELITGLKSTEHCIGFLYWDPMLIHVEDEDGNNLVGWAVKEEDDKSDVNVVENSTLFDFDGHALEALEVIRDHAENGRYINPVYTDGVLTSVSISDTINDDSRAYCCGGEITLIDRAAETGTEPEAERQEATDDNEPEVEVALYPAEKDGLYGYVDGDGNIVIDYKYVGAEEFSEGLALVHKSGAMDGEYGFINADGEEVIPCIYSDACSFSDGAALVTEANHTENEDWYYIDKNGNRLFDTQYPIMRSFHDGYALVLKEGYGFPVPPSVDIPKKWAYMTKSGELANDMEFDDAYDFSEGYAIVKNNGKWGVIDTDFNLVVDYKYDNIGSGFKNGIVPVYDENYEVLYYITYDGTIVEQ